VVTANFIGRIPVQRLMNTLLVVVLYERVEFSFKVLRIQKEGVVKKLTNGSDQSFNKGMRTRGIRDAFDLKRPESSSSLAIGDTGIADRSQN